MPKKGLYLNSCGDPRGALFRWLWSAHMGYKHTFDHVWADVDGESNDHILGWLMEHPLPEELDLELRYFAELKNGARRLAVAEPITEEALRGESRYIIDVEEVLNWDDALERIYSRGLGSDIVGAEGPRGEVRANVGIAYPADEHFTDFRLTWANSIIERTQEVAAEDEDTTVPEHYTPLEITEEVRAAAMTIANAIPVSSWFSYAIWLNLDSKRFNP